MMFDIWMEGFRLSGEEEAGTASFVGRAEGNTFREAVLNWYKEHPNPNFSSEHLTDWGCRLYATEAEARKTFG